MSQMTILDNDYASLWYYPESKIIHHKFKRFMFGDRFREVLSKGAEVFAQHGARKWLSDDRNNSAVPADDAKWGMEVWTPKVMKAGWKYWAIVMPDKEVGRMSMQRFIKTYSDQGVLVELFDDPKEAMRWLETRS